MNFKQLFYKLALNMVNKPTIGLLILASGTVNYGMESSPKPFGSGRRSSFTRFARAQQPLSRSLTPDPDLILAPDLILIIYNLHDTAAITAVKRLPKSYLNKQARTTFYCASSRNRK